MRNTTRTKVRNYETFKAYKKALDSMPNFWDRVITEKTAEGWRITTYKYRQFNS